MEQLDKAFLSSSNSELALGRMNFSLKVSVLGFYSPQRQGLVSLLPAGRGLATTLCDPHPQQDRLCGNWPALVPRCDLSTVLVQFSSVAQLHRLFVTTRIAAHQASLSITNSWSSLKLMSIELVMPSSHLILCRPLLLLPPIPPCIRVFSNESTLHIRGPKYWSFSFNISPSNEHPGLISFRMDWLDLLAVSQESSPTPQFKSINCSALSFLYTPTLTSIHDY